jgi:uridine kinase
MSIKKTVTPGFETAKDLSSESRAVETSAFEKIRTDEEKLISDYLAKNGKVVNTDDFRPFFKDVGYNGSNAAAVQEPSSYLGKKTFSRLLAENPERFVTFLAGGSGSGKTSAVKNLAELSKTKQNSAAILDSNLSSYSSAKKRIDEVENAGKEVRIEYVYRDPVDAFENGVVTRMLNNPDEMGRLVPSKVVAGNHIDSFNVVRRLHDEGYRVVFIDNSLGQGKAKIIDKSNLEKKVNFPTKEKLTSQFNSIAKRLYDEGTITEEQYRGYIE